MNSTNKSKIFVLEFLYFKPVRWFIGLLILIGLTATVLNSYPKMEHHKYFFYTVAFFSAIFFTFEYILRIFAAPAMYAQEAAWKARLKYLFSFMGMIDFLSILPFTIPYFVKNDAFAGNAIEFGRLMIIFKLFRYTDSYRTIQIVLSSIKYELMTSLSFVAIIVSIAAVLMYYIENGAQPDKFSSIGEGFWWAVITFTSIGYGDIYPITPLGKVMAGSMAIIGLIIFALPTALVSGAYIAYLQQPENKRKKEEEKIAGKEEGES
ncbi:MAG: ion transporter [Bacteroidales bacterium]